MVDFVVYNELSLPFKDNINIENKFIDFLYLLEIIRQKGIKRIRTTENFKNYNILEEVSFQQFFGQLNDKELRHKILSFMNNGFIILDSPLIKDEEIDEVQDSIESNYYFNNEIFFGGLACCDIWNTIAISFESHDNWKRDIIVLKKNNENIDIKHVSNVAHLNTHDVFFEELEKENKLNITQKNLWDKKYEFFPKKILFCKEVENQIQKLNKNIFIQAIGILRDIENGSKSISDYNYSPESLSVHQNPDLKKLRLFTFKNIKMCFDNHIKFSSNRIYFLERKGKVYIGYIGKHLKTKKY